MGGVHPGLAGAGLKILSTTPADFSTGVPLETGIEIQFDAAIDTTARLADGQPIGAFIVPRDSLVIRQHQTGDDRTELTLDVAHTRETDFTWIATGAEGADTTSLDIPYVLRYTTTRPARVNLGLFNILGQQVHAVVEAEFMPSGSHQIRLDASSLAAGTYICRLQVGGATQSRLIFVTR